MNRKVLLVEPNYKNKYPPMPLMKLATYFRRCGDDVRFYKGDLKALAAELLCEEFYAEVNDAKIAKYYDTLLKYIRVGRYDILEGIPVFDNNERYVNLAKAYRLRYMNKDYPRFDVVAVTTLFTFYWGITIDTINFCKYLVLDVKQLHVGGIAATILPQYIEKETGIKPHVGLLDKPGVMDAGNTDVIDELPLDYSILEEIDYVYPAGDAYFAYMTRGCIRNCAFCAVKILEPKYKDYISIRKQLKCIDETYGRKKNLLLMDNNVLASNSFERIIDEVIDCGYSRGASYIPDDSYEIALNNVRKGYNLRGYIKKLIAIYDKIASKLSDDAAGDFYLEREKQGLLYVISAKQEAILDFDEIAAPLYKKFFKVRSRKRAVDFNQGIDARLVTDSNMNKLSETAIDPLRIAFDHYEQKDIYIKAVKTAAKNGINHLSNYLLYNFMDKPNELYYRMKINVELCEELGITIYSFPMKYHPINDPVYFRNRDYIGKFWNRKFIRAVQAVLNATKGKIGRGKSFFEEAFGKNVEEFENIMWMPEAFIINRFKYKETLTKEWREKFYSLEPCQLNEVKKIVAANDFSDSVIRSTNDDSIHEVLRYYQISRD